MTAADSIDTLVEDCKHRILHLLTIYPIISPSMMQIGIGSSIPAALWRTCLDMLIEEGKVKEDILAHIGPKGRNQAYTLISLKDTEVKVLTLQPTAFRVV